MMGQISEWLFNSRYDGEMLDNDYEMVVDDDEMSVWSYTHFTIIDEHFQSLRSILPSLEHFQSLRSILPSLDWSKPSFAHLTIIKKLHLK